ncbi:TIGR03757 family integrating conjugative element protein [Erwinia psidii]|uniref:TIGR03757 family integrating conjugative element protein n=1 Tax=Erwinia psidii TaxID=69224 RepID=UPI00226BAC56|nr:TIGR03757 family integrating conjugative element protein [Erwinia psidii]MCX8959106.1 TIGR03757 family integrating conjugative element protein [Erwinia psidii]
MKLSPLFLLPVLLPASALAGTVVFTDTRHPPQNLPADVPVVLLDGPERLQAELFGSLSADPQRAEAQVRQVMASPGWQQGQQRLADNYRQVVHAWTLGVRKVPAVVFDDRDVVYGTADVAVATSLRQRGGGQ